MLLGQYNTEAILSRHINRFKVSIEYGTELSSLEQCPDHVEAVLVKNVDGVDEIERLTCHWLIGADGARGMNPRSPSHLPCTRNLLDLTRQDP